MILASIPRRIAVRSGLRTAMIFVAAVVATGCGTPPVPVNYAPSSVMTATGAMSVGEFTYAPAQVQSQPMKSPDDKKSKPAPKQKVIAANQIRNTAMGNIFIDRDVKVFVRDAVFAELRFVGIKTDGGRVTLTGDVEEFLIDDLGYSVDWTLRVHYVLKDSKQQVVYDSVKNTQRHTAKFANVFGALNETIKVNAEELLKDNAFLDAIKK